MRGRLRRVACGWGWGEGGGGEAVFASSTGRKLRDRGPACVCARARAWALTSMISLAAGEASSAHQAREGDAWLKAMGKPRKEDPRGTRRLMATEKSSKGVVSPSAAAPASPVGRPRSRSCACARVREGVCVCVCVW